MKSLLVTLIFALYFSCSIAETFFVAATGSDQSGNGSKEKPWRSIAFALKSIPHQQQNTLQLLAGTYTESGQLSIPSTLNLVGAGVDLTIIKAAPSFYFHPDDPGSSPEKFLIALVESTNTHTQKLMNFTVDGNARQVHGGIYIDRRDLISIDHVRVRNVNFCGIWLVNSKNSSIKNTSLFNCSWGNTDWCSGALQLGNVSKTEIDNLYINEDRGYGIKAVRPDPGSNQLTEVKIHDSHISVNPTGLWKDGKAPNISIELWSANLMRCEISNSLVDNHISVVNTSFTPPSNTPSIRIHHNTIDLEARAKGEGYGMELSVNNAEIDHNIFKGGQYGIVNWDEAVKNWSIHHNIFYGLKNFYPGEILRSQKGGLHSVKFYNNTVEMLGSTTINLIGLYGGESQDLDIKNNLVINSNTAYNHYPNKFLHQENCTVTALTIMNNALYNIATDGVAGNLKNNLSADPKINKSGARHTGYYRPVAGSPLIDAGIDVKLPFRGSAPDIGAHEF
jgi:hypothetical protein